MSLFGSLTSGVSGLAAQSSAMGAIADNITNVNTVGYKGTKVDFQTMVTKQASTTQYASGGVQSRPRAGIDVQGLLQSSASATSLAISGQGFFLVNEANKPGNGDQFLVTRAGAFVPDNEGYLRNTAGYYLQAWPTDADGNVVLPRSSQATLTNENVVSTDFLETVNLNRVSGTSSPTSRISIGANLPAYEEVGNGYNIDVQFFDAIGNTNAVSMRFSKSGINTWDLSVDPPTGAAVTNLYDAGGAVYQSVAQIEFTRRPVAGASITIDSASGGSRVFTFGDGSGGTVRIDSSLEQTVVNLMSAIRADAEFSGADGHHRVATKPGSSTTLVFTSGNRAGLDPLDIDVSALDADGGAKAVKQGSLETPVFTILPRPAGSSAPALSFNGRGLPTGFGVAKMEVLGFSSGAADMDGVDHDLDGVADAEMIALDFGKVGETGGITQFGTAFNPAFIEQNGARFGLFTGVTVDSNGLVSALFDNGESRPIYRLPLVTFVNPNGLEARSGNTWQTTPQSGEPVLRKAKEGPTGEVVQSSLESSTVDIGEEFTRMIVVQRAYSAATKIISTADEMMDELTRIRR